MCSYNGSCSAPTTGTATATFAAAVQYFAAAQCLLTEEPLPEAYVRNFSEYDFIIVGAGSAGCVLANRLSEVKEWNILLVEAGGDPPIEANVPGYTYSLWSSEYDWGYTTTNDGIINQANTDGTIYWPRGKLIGGSSNVNAMIYIKGNDHDYQRWYDAGNEEWSVAEVRRCFKKAENFQDAILDQYPEVYNTYGHQGPLVINTFNHTQRALSQKILTAFDEIGITTVPDLNAAKVFGSGIMRCTAANSERYSVSKAYLVPIKDRPNLTVMKNALVTKVLINNAKKAFGVIIRQNSKKMKIYAKKEVIVSAGAINSPKLLMLSGVGPKNYLKSNNLRVKADLPLVGQNLMDHVVIPVTIYSDAPNATASDTQEADSQFDVFKYLYNRSGAQAHIPFLDILAFYSVDKNARYPDFEIYSARHKKNKAQFGEFLKFFSRYKDSVVDSVIELNKKYTLDFFLLSLLHPHSKGNISLNSNDPRGPPHIYPKYFSDPRDLELAVNGIEEMMKILNSTLYKSSGGFLGRMKWPECDKFELGSRDYWKCICVNMVGTIYHPISTCKMGASSEDSVVSSRLKVHEVEALRVIDASVMPSHISGNPNGACVVIGERGAELVKEDHGKA